MEIDARDHADVAAGKLDLDVVVATVALGPAIEIDRLAAAGIGDEDVGCRRPMIARGERSPHRRHRLVGIVDHGDIEREAEGGVGSTRQCQPRYRQAGMSTAISAAKSSGAA